MVSPVTNTDWLQCIERLMHDSARSALAALPRFHCLLDEQPDHLVPEHYLRNQAFHCLADGPLFLNPCCLFARDGELPRQLDRDPCLHDLAFDPDTVWLQDPGSEALLPFSLSSGLFDCLAKLPSGQPAAPALAPELRYSLAMAGVLVPQEYASERRRQWAETVVHWKAQFQSRGYAPVGCLIHPFHVAALRRYFRGLIRAGKMQLGDTQSARRFVAHNESVSRFFQHQLTKTVAGVVGEPVKPSYVYVASYQEGAVLKKHTDREQCEFSITLCIDYSPEPFLETPWPLRLHTPSATTTVFQAIGDGLLYRGRELPHARGPLPAGHTSTSIFFHFVRENFDGPLD
jgi:hypothetical protein